MKLNKALWFISFLMSFTAILLSFFVFGIYVQSKKVPDDDVETPTDKSIEQQTYDEYYEPQDNVGAVTFTEDQITELARKIFSYDDFLSDVDVQIDESEISISAKIKNSKKLVETYPELEKYKSIITTLQNKTISVNGTIKNQNGRSAIGIKKVSVGGIAIDGAIISPFIEEDDFSQLFDVDFNNIELTKDAVVFKNGVPDILKY